MMTVNQKIIYDLYRNTWDDRPPKEPTSAPRRWFYRGQKGLPWTGARIKAASLAWAGWRAGRDARRRTRREA